MMKYANIIVMTAAGLLLIAATGLKVYQMIDPFDTIDSCVPSWQDKSEGVVNAAAAKNQPVPPKWKSTVLGAWESYEFALFQVPLEFALGVWLLCGLFRRAAWTAGTLAFLFFIGVTTTKWLTGAADCGCWGHISVEPWKTLFFVDVPVFLAMVICRPKGCKLLPPPWPRLTHLLVVFVPTIAVMVLAAPLLVAFRPVCKSAKDIKVSPDAALKLKIRRLEQDLSGRQQEIEELKAAIEELRKTPRTTDQKAYIGVLELIAADKPNIYEIHIGGRQTLLLNAENIEDIYLAVTEAERQTLTITETGRANVRWTAPPEPEQVETPTDDVPAAKQWEWLPYVVEDEVREQICEGLAIVVMHRHDCSVCVEMAPRYSEYYKEMTDAGTAEFTIAFLAVPPYHEEEDTVPDDTTCILGKMSDEEDWGFMSPLIVALIDGELVHKWEQGTAPEPENIIAEVFGE